MFGPLLQGPSYRAMTAPDLAYSAFTAPTSMGDYLNANFGEGFVHSFGLGTVLREALAPPRAPTAPEDLGIAPPGAVPLETQDEFEKRRAAMRPLTEEAYKASPYFRKEIPWDAGMTESRAATLALWRDESLYRQSLIERGPRGSGIIGFGAQLAGGALDPINYIPIFGPASRAAAVSRFGAVVGRGLVSAGEAAVNVAVAGALTTPSRRSFGDDTSLEAYVTAVAMGALIGGAFGGIAGGVGRLRANRELNRLATVKAAREGLNTAVGDMVHGRPVDVGPAVVEEAAALAVSRAAARDAELARASEREIAAIDDARTEAARLADRHGVEVDIVEDVNGFRTVPVTTPPPRPLPDLLEIANRKGGRYGDTLSVIEAKARQGMPDQDISAGGAFTPDEVRIIRESLGIGPRAMAEEPGASPLAAGKNDASSRNTMPTLYHGTAEVRDRIIAPNVLDEYGPGAYLTTVDDLAKRYAKRDAPDGKGIVYTVKVDAEPDQFVKWDLPLTDRFQSKRVMAELRRIYGKELPRQTSDLFARRFNDARGAALMRSTEVVGVKFRDKSIGTPRQLLRSYGRANYTVWDEKRLSISDGPVAPPRPRIVERVKPSEGSAAARAAEAIEPVRPVQGDAAAPDDTATSLLPADELAKASEVNPETGDFPELAEYERLDRLGLLDEADKARFDEADAVLKRSAVFADALDAFAACKLG